jgi:SSS family transporter
MASQLALVAALAVLVATVGIGLYSGRRAKTLSDFWVAGRSVGVFTNASAISSNYLSAASFLGVAAFIWATGFDGVWYATGFAAGYVLLLLFIASPLRRFGQYTIPDFCHGRFGSIRLRRVGILWTVVISSLYIVAQMVGVGTLMESLTGIPWAWGVILLGGVIILYVAFGGMTGVTITQMLQFWIMLVAMLLPLIVLLSQYSYGELLMHAFGDSSGVTVSGGQAFSPAEQAAIGTGGQWIRPFNQWDLVGSLSLLVALVCGTAGLPHILARFYTNPDVRKARWSTVWVLVFVGIFYITTPIWGTYARMILGPEAVLVEGGVANPNSMMLVTSGAAGEWAMALVAAGTIAALLSTVAGLLIALSSAFAHDFYGSILRPQASDRQKILVAKAAVIGFGVLAIMVGLGFRGLNIAWMVGLAFAVAASTFFPLLTLGIWWRKTTESGAIAGVMLGGTIAAVVVVGKLVGLWSFDQPALISVPAAFVTIIAVSRRTYQRESAEVRAALEAAFQALHVPERRVREPAPDAGAPGPEVKPGFAPVPLASGAVPSGGVRPRP